jgi:Siphovirus protein of unknown function (DUF859)
MARSSDFGTTNANIVYWIEAIVNSQNTSNNTSNVTVRVWCKRTNSGYTTYGSGTAYCTINGTQYTDAIATSETITSTPRELLQKTVTVTHASDGTKTLTMTADIAHTAFDGYAGTWNYDLPDIARATDPTVYSATLEFGNTQTIYTYRASSSFTHTLRYKIGTATGTIATGVETAHYWAVPESLMNNIPDKTSATITVYCDTYNGSTFIGTEYVQFTATVPSSVIPTFTAVTHSENVSAVSAVTTSYVQNKSRLNLAISGASGAYGSSIESYEINFDGVQYSASSVVSNTVKNYGTLTITGKITDSRGRSQTKTVNVTVLQYAAPRISQFTVSRATSGGVESDTGTYANVNRAGLWDTLGGTNNLTIKIKSKLRSSATWIEKSSTVATTGNFASTVTVGTYPLTESHDFMVEVTDAFNTTIALTVLSTGLVTMSWSSEGVGIGKVWEQGALDVVGNSYFTGDVDVTGNANVGGYLDVAGSFYANTGNIHGFKPSDVGFKTNVYAYCTSKQSFPSSTATKVNFQGEVYDDGSEFIASTGTFYPNESGYYRVDFYYEPDGTTLSTGSSFHRIFANLYRNGSEDITIAAGYLNLNSSIAVYGTGVIYLDATDTMDVRIWCSSAFSNRARGTRNYDYIRITRAF